MRVLALSMVLLLATVCAPVLAQTGLDEKQKAVMVFDVRFDLIQNSDLGTKLDLEGKMAEMSKSAGEENGLANATRVFGAMSAPEDMAAAQTMQQGGMPIEFFVRFVFKDEASAKKMMAKAEEDNGGTIERNGKTYYKPKPGGGAPEGLLMYAIDGTTIEMGTEAYVFRANPTPFTDNLKAAWAKAPSKKAIRLAMDLQGAKGLISEAVEMGKQQGDPTMGIYLDLVDNIKDLRISLDFSGENLLTLNATGVNASDAEELKEGLDSLLGMAKLGAQASLPQIKKMDPEGGAVVEKLVESLNATNDGTDVSVVIPKPDGFDKAVENAVSQFGAMFGMPPGNGAPNGG